MKYHRLSSSGGIPLVVFSATLFSPPAVVTTVSDIHLKVFPHAVQTRCSGQMAKIMDIPFSKNMDTGDHVTIYDGGTYHSK